MLPPHFGPKAHFSDPPAGLAMVSTQKPRAPEFSRLLNLSDMDGDESTVHLEANQSERQAIAARLGLEELQALNADVTIRRGRVKGALVVSGSLEAKVVQLCVVTLEPLENTVESQFETIYACDAAELEGFMSEEGVDDPPEPIRGNRIDLGEEVIQQLACALDPYPRAEGAEIDSRWGVDPNESAKSGPFAALDKLRRDGGGR